MNPNVSFNAVYFIIKSVSQYNGQFIFEIKHDLYCHASFVFKKEAPFSVNTAVCLFVCG